MRALIPAFLLSVLLGGCGHLPPLISRRDPLNAGEHAALGASYAAQGLKKEAAAQYLAAAKLNRKEPEAWVAAGNAAFDGDDLPGAERAYRRALKLSPHHAGASNNLAMAFLAGGRNLSEAESLALAALAGEGPLKPYILDTLANIYQRQGRLLEARAALDRAAEAPPAGDASFAGRLAVTREGLTEKIK